MKTFWSFLLLAALLTEISCYPVKAYRLNALVTTLRPGITLAYVEFDDNGEMYDVLHNGVPDRPELDQTIAAIMALEKQSPDGINVVLFVHGWKNNADNTNNVAGFQAFLQFIQSSYAAPNAAPLMGIYIGWRGASVKTAKDLSYWSRTNATQRVAGPNLDEALFQIIRAVKTRRKDYDGASNLIMIGHSFGGRVLEKAMTAYLEGQLLTHDPDHIGGCVVPSNAAPPPADFPMPDLTVLLNEAAPATDAKQFLEMMKCHAVTNRKYWQAKKQEADFPLLLSVTSVGDSATSIALPIGQTVSRLELKTRDYGSNADPPEIRNQSTYYIHSAANIPALHSHELKTTACAPDEIEVPLPHLILGQYRLCGVHRTGTPPYWNHTPYWITNIPVNIVPDHSDIFQPALYGFLSEFLPEASDLRTPKTSNRPKMVIQ
jgi:hypothetical protein